MTAGEDITIGELSRTIAGMEGRMTQRFAEVNRRLDGLQFVNQDTYRVQVSSIEKRLDDLEEDQTWNRRAILGAFVFAPVAAAMGALITIAVR